jgi:hypothetical protein
MKQLINHILLPVQFDAQHLAVVKQAAELAKEYKATIHLLYINDTGLSIGNTMLPWLTLAKTFYTTTREKTALLNTWKRWIEQNYEIPVTTTVEWGSWKKMVLGYANKLQADLLILKEQPVKKRWFRFWHTAVEYVIEKCPCQVITLFSEKEKMAEWKQVVIPVTNFVPELRIQTISNIAKALKLKIYLVTMANGEHDKRSSGFYFLTETLKRLKHNASIQVECKYLETESNAVFGFLKYANSIGADLMMTNSRIADTGEHGAKQKAIDFFAEYQYNRQPLHTVAI